MGKRQVLEPRGLNTEEPITVTGVVTVKGQASCSGRLPEGCLEASGGMVRRLPPPLLSGVSSVGNE